MQTQLAVLRLAKQHIDITVSVHRGQLPVAEGGAAPDARTALRLSCGAATSGDRMARIDAGLNALREQMARDARRPPPVLLLDEPSLNGRASLDAETRRARRRLAARSDLLIEDASAHGPPYVDFLCGVHRSIQQRIAADRAR